MAVEDHEVTALQRLGLTEYESKIYLTLLKMGPIKASEVSFRAHVPRTKTYGSIRQLKEKNLISIFPGKPEIYFIDKSPDEVLSPIVNTRETELKESKDLIQNLALVFKTKMIVKGEIRKESGELWMIEGRANIFETLNQLFLNAKKSINYFTTTNGLIRAYKANADMLEKASRRGVNVSLLANITKENVTVAREMAEIVELKNNNNSLPPETSSFISVDSHDLVILEARPDDLSIDRGTDSSVWTNNPSLVTVHHQLFLKHWDNLPKFKPSESKE
ncbi:MAG TPA: helix-turn-helix domain-containing protein [Candidatus Saccharimonadales bacterium]|nr:helix-turn-helix domain-containing protein [Candidatus Saccharimonadales bacterium]